jgi:translation initiation factor 1 (eIF-1/SUI1)
VNLVEHGHGEYFADTGNGAESEESTGIVDLGLSSEEELEILDEQVEVAGELDVCRDTLKNGEVGKLLRDTLSIASIVETRSRSRKIVLVVSVLDVHEEVASLAYQLESSTKQVAGGAHLGWIDVSLRKHTSPK